MFVRQKNIKNQPYGYLVKNVWAKRPKNRGTKQKVVKYLGRINILDKKDDVSWDGFIQNKIDTKNNSVEDMTPKQLIVLLVKYELTKYGFEQSTRSDSILRLENFLVDIDKIKVRLDDKETVLKLNQDFMCKYTLKRLFGFKHQGTEQEVGLELAKVLVGAGLICPQEIFLIIFNKIFSDGGVSSIEYK